MDDLLFQDLFINFSNGLKACKIFVELLEDYDDVMKRSILCMVFDMLFKEKSVENAEICLEQIKKVNEEMGSLT